MKVYLNLDAIIANVKRLGSSTKAIDMSEILSQAVTSLLPLVTDGVPLTYEKNEGKLKVYLNTDLLLPLMKAVFGGRLTSNMQMCCRNLPDAIRKKVT